MKLHIMRRALPVYSNMICHGERSRTMIHKMSIASKEARETQYWLKILDQGKIVKLDFAEYMEEIQSIINITTAIVKTAQKSMN